VITRSNLNQFANFFHRYKQNENCKRFYLAICITSVVPCENKTLEIYENRMVNTTKLSSYTAGQSTSWTRYWCTRL